jgi:type II secretory pathway pseudopilin PulG
MKRQALNVILSAAKDLGRRRGVTPRHLPEILRSLRSLRTTMYKSQPGLGLVETLVAVAILGTCVAAFAAGLSAGSLAAGEQRTQTMAQELAQNELEYVKRVTFEPGAGTYPAVASPEGYAIDVAVDAVPGADADIQKITVSILRDGQNVLTLADYKVNR